MSEQILLQGKILGIAEFLLAGGGVDSHGPSGEDELAGRSQFVTLLCEVLPRALLLELGLPRVLLGSSGGGQFLLILPGDARGPAEDFLVTSAKHLLDSTQGHLKLLWAVTENLGDWSVVRRRINEELTRKRGTPLAGAGPEAFLPINAGGDSRARRFALDFGLHSRQAGSAGWSPESPGEVGLSGGKHQWQLTTNVSLEGITLARHTAPSEDGKHAASVQTLARRSQGRRIWGVLRGDVDGFGVRMRRVTSIEEHVQLSVMYRQFFAGELQIQASLPDFWRKITILYSGGDDFAVYGAWDALIQFAREMQRVFHRFSEENLKEFPGAEGKTITMALALAPAPDASFAHVYREAGQHLEHAKSADKDCMFLLGRVLEWKQLSDAAELKESVTRMTHQLRGSRNLIQGLRSFYQREVYNDPLSPQAPLVQRGWKFQRRFSRLLSGTRNREFQKLRAHLISEAAVKKNADVKLRPAGLVALEWARLATEV